MRILDRLFTILLKLGKIIDDSDSITICGYPFCVVKGLNVVLKFVYLHMV